MDERYCKKLLSLTKEKKTFCSFQKKSFIMKNTLYTI